MTLLTLALAWTAGILLGHLLWSAGVTGCATPAWPFAAGSMILLIPVLLGRRHRRARISTVLVLAALLGVWRYTAHPVSPCIAPESLAYRHAGLDKPPFIIVEGVIVSYPEQHEGQYSYRLRAERLWDGDASLPVTGDILVKTRDHLRRHYGDRVRVTGSIEDPPIYADFDYRAYLARQGIQSRMTRARTELIGEAEISPLRLVLYRFRDHASELLNRLLPEPSASLAKGMLLGIEDGIPQDLLDAFQATGATHVIVISGSNIALLAGVLLALLGHLIGRTRAVIPVIVVIGLYVLLVGAGPAALRAGIMGALFAGAIGLGRQSTAWVSLAASAMLMTVINPTALWDAGFQISFAATLGLILFSPWLLTQFHRAFGGRLAGEQASPPLRAISDGLAATLATQVLVTPVFLYHFGRLSATSLLANALILPAQPPILAGGMLALLAGLVWEPLGRVVAWIPWLFITYTTEVVKLVAGLPFGVVDAGPWAKSAAMAYVVVLLSGLGLWKGMQTGFLALPPRRHLMMIGAVALPLWMGLAGASLRPDGMLHITFLPPDGSESALLTLPDGTRLLIADLASEQSEKKAPLPTRRVELIIAPAALQAPDPKTRQSGGRRLDPTQLAPHTTLRLSGGVTLERLGDAEHWALVVRYGAFRTILPATLDLPTQDALVDQGDLTGTTLLKLPGGGTGAWPNERFLNAATPQVLLWPLGTTYPPSVASRLTGRAQRIPDDATIEIITDGKQFRLRQLTSSPDLLP